jgi:hypothetical protein
MYEFTPADPTIKRRFKARLFLILWLVGLAGVLSILLIDLPTLIAALPWEKARTSSRNSLIHGPGTGLLRRAAFLASDSLL